MIYIATTEKALRTSLRLILEKNGMSSTFCAMDAFACLSDFYRPDVEAIVADIRHPMIPSDAWLDLLGAASERVPTIVVGQHAHLPAGLFKSLADTVTILNSSATDGIFEAIAGKGPLANEVPARRQVPIFDLQVARHMLESNGSLSVLSIDATSFRKVAIGYGNDAYVLLQDCFQELMFDLWGSSGSFRACDILSRKSPTSNRYFVFLERSRNARSVPAPGSLEKLADRLAVRLHQLVWAELSKKPAERRLPDCLKIVPDFAIGHATALYNPCVDPVEAVESLLDCALDVGRVQRMRTKDRRREFIQSLISNKSMLKPKYQAVFVVEDLTDELILESKQKKSIKPLEPFLYGFESLIRIVSESVEGLRTADGPSQLESRYLNPEVLFSLADSSKLTLELDQVCLEHACKYAGDLPGRLMVNILPRNLYYVDRLHEVTSAKREIVFEVSESEAINNFELLLETREKLSRKNHHIATDDFGKGFAGLDRVIKIKPDIVKLDRSLIQDIHLDNPKKAFVEGLVSAAKMSKSKILAEGVELIEELQVLREIGVELIQGFLLHRPQDRDEIMAELEEEADNVVDLKTAS